MCGKSNLKSSTVFLVELSLAARKIKMFTMQALDKNSNSPITTNKQPHLKTKNKKTKNPITNKHNQTQVYNPNSEKGKKMQRKTELDTLASCTNIHTCTNAHSAHIQKTSRSKQTSKQHKNTLFVCGRSSVEIQLKTSGPRSKPKFSTKQGTRWKEKKSSLLKYFLIHFSMRIWAPVLKESPPSSDKSVLGLNVIEWLYKEHIWTCCPSGLGAKSHILQ